MKDYASACPDMTMTGKATVYGRQVYPPNMEAELQIIEEDYCLPHAASDAAGSDMLSVPFVYVD